MNYLDRKFGTGWPKYGAAIALEIVGIALWSWHWYIGLAIIVGTPLLFWWQRNTK